MIGFLLTILIEKMTLEILVQIIGLLILFGYTYYTYGMLAEMKTDREEKFSPFLAITKQGINFREERFCFEIEIENLGNGPAIGINHKNSEIANFSIETNSDIDIIKPKEKQIFHIKIKMAESLTKKIKPNFILKLECRDIMNNKHSFNYLFIPYQLKDGVEKYRAQFIGIEKNKHKNAPIIHEIA